MEHKKQNFLQGAAMLAAATVLVKVIGALYKIPLKLGGHEPDDQSGYRSGALQPGAQNL